MLARVVSLLATFLFVLTSGVALHAQDAPPLPPTAIQIKESLSLKEQILARQYQEFEQQLLRLKQRLDLSAKPLDRDRAVVLGRVLEFCKEKSISVRFEQMIDILQSKELTNLPDIKEALSRSSGIDAELQSVIAMLREDTRSLVLKGNSLKAILKDLDRNIQDQQSVRGMTDNGKTDRDELKRNQEMVAKRTADLEKRLREFAPGDPASGVKQIREANDRQEQAQGKIERGNNDGASGDQGSAIIRLEDVRDRLEKLLRQLRDEELERILASLLIRCEKMLAMQTDVLTGTEAVDKAIRRTADTKPRREDKHESLKLSSKEADIVLESKAIEILEAEGSGVAFPEVLQQLRDDMKHVERRLGIADTGEVTQAIERDIADTLKEMIAALKKKKDEVGVPVPTPPTPPGETPPRQDPKLLEKVAELKMIRSLQARVNARTQIFGQRYQGEQANDAGVRQELHNLSERQERIVEITRRIAKGDNR